VRFALNDVFLETREMPQADFFARLADVLPVIDGGRYRVSVESQTVRRWRESVATEVSPTLSAALLMLEANGDLRIELRSDAAQRMLLGRAGRELRPITHVVRSETS
jgi:hypothetical protein